MCAGTCEMPERTEAMKREPAVFDERRVLRDPRRAGAPMLGSPPIHVSADIHELPHMQQRRALSASLT